MNDFFVLEENITNPEIVLQYEWLETNGLGSYSSSTPYCCNTRKYHGLLVVPIAEYASRYVLLSKYLTSVSVGNKEFHLSTSKFPGVYYPNGHKYISSFSYENNCPQILFQIGNIKIKKSICMLENKHAVIVNYELCESERACTFCLNPFLAYRDFNALQKNNFSVRPAVQKTKGEWVINPYEGMPALHFKTNVHTKFYPAPDWYENCEHLKEMVRGYDYVEDLFTPGVFEARLEAGQSFKIMAGIEKEAAEVEELWNTEIERRKKEAEKTKDTCVVGLKKNALYIDLKKNGKKFLINKERKGKPSIIAGYPWFGEWGRDTMISISGLTLYSGREELFFDILHSYLADVKDGLIPNQLDVYGKSSYNSVDASLWFFLALQQYLQYSSNKKNVNKEKARQIAANKIYKEFGPAMKNIIETFLSNTIPNVRRMDNGLLLVGNAYTQLTWMDASVDGQPVTARHGHPIEINALWYHALKLYKEVGELHAKEHKNKETEPLSQLLLETIDLLEKNFEEHYYLKEEKYLCDNIIDGRQIKEIRPNQLAALAVPYALISDETAKTVLETIMQALFTPVGLRSLSPSDPCYQGLYHGNQKERDRQYHQGTIWPFLLGICTDAFIRVHHKNKLELNTYKNTLLSALEKQVYSRGIGGLSEIHDGNHPYYSRGCPFQAWSVAETIRSIEKLQEVI